jgi:maltodextrin utilization protein YvdJ
MIEVLKENNIPVTIHWGKSNDWNFPGLVNHMYKEMADKWVEQREKLLTPEMQFLFSNKFLSTVGLYKKV